MSGEFNQILFIYNQKATNFERARKLSAQVKNNFKSAKLHQIKLFDSKLPAKDDVISTARNFDDKTLVLIGGGDGTVNFVINTILTSDDLSEQNKQAVFLPLWGGNANDLAAMLNGSVSNNLDKLFKNSKIADVYPLSVKIANDAEESFDLAMNYTSLGMSAYAIKKIEQSSKQSTLKILAYLPFRLLAEALDVFRAVIEAQPFMIDEYQEQTRQVSEVLFVNGSRIAKIGRFPSSIFEQSFLVASSKKGSLWMDLIKIVFRPKSFTITSEPQKFLLKDDTLAQLDGETKEVKSGSTIEVKVHHRPYRALSTKNS